MTSRYPLERLWTNRIRINQWEDEASLVAHCSLGSFDRGFNGFLVMRYPHFNKSSAARNYIMIPRCYKNGVRLLNAKISCIQQSMKLLHSPESNTVTEKAVGNAALAQDVLLHLLSLSVSVREEFFSGVNKQFYAGEAFIGRRQKPKMAFTDDYRCPVMDVWLFTEFYCGYQDPYKVNEKFPGFDWEKGVEDVRNKGKYSKTSQK
jgi:hypothetical protein